MISTGGAGILVSMVLGVESLGARIERSTSLGHKTLYETDGRGDLLSLTFGVDPRWMDFSPESLRMGGPPARGPWKATWKRDPAGNETERRLPARATQTIRMPAMQSSTDQ